MDNTKIYIEELLTGQYMVVEYINGLYTDTWKYFDTLKEALEQVGKLRPKFKGVIEVKYA